MIENFTISQLMWLGLLIGFVIALFGWLNSD